MSRWCSLTVSIVILQAAVSVCKGQGVIQMEIACTSYIWPADGNTALAFHRPAFEAAVEECNRIYAGIFHFTMAFPSTDIESDRLMIPFSTNTADILAKWYWSRPRNSTSIAAVLSPGTFDYPAAHQLTSNWNILCMTTMASLKSGYTIQPQTMMIALSIVSLENIMLTMIQLLDQYGWTRVYVIIDLSSVNIYRSFVEEWERHYTGQTTRTTVRRVQCNTLTSFAPYLNEFKDFSRVMVFSGNANQLRRLMIEAHGRNLTSGEFVYVCFEPYEFPKSYGYLNWQRSNDTSAANEGSPHLISSLSDELWSSVIEAAKDAFRSVLAVHLLNNPRLETVTSKFGTSIDDLALRFRTRSTKLYNISLTAYDQPIPDLLSSYAGLFVYAQVLNETLATYGAERLHDGIWMSRQFLRRKFPAPGGLSDIYVDGSGQRNVLLAVSQLAGMDAVRRTYLVQSYLNGTMLLKMTRNLSDSWPGGHWPPPNEPLCGYRNDKSICRRDTFPKRSLSIGLTIACVIFLMIVIVTYRVRSYRLDDSRSWWLPAGAVVATVP